ncbi:carboxypeptidase-like regulatory domain-containing protein [Actinoplanes subtropicus]|uniref:carboxypeptidase-like regulatory domain-containing protein n=1 Tax=Actinoplanes subtropicus TaxID=543632 RepID=UPI000AFC277F|nr:carboxypeptidase-like regulatory domain-containing protein [Actinoplanes subtropicus]
MRTPRVIAGVVLAGLAAAMAVASPALADTGTGSLSGSVRDTRGAVMAGTEILVYPLTPAGGSVAETHTDAAGRFRVTGLEAAGYKIYIGLGGWYEYAPGRTDSFDAARTYAVVAGRNTVANSVVTAASTIRGTVLAASGGPAAGVTVTAENDEHAAAWSATTAADGTYTMRVAPDRYYVIRFTDGHFEQFAPGTLDRAQARQYPVRSGRTLRVSERLLPAASLTGRLVDAAGAPVADAAVHLVTTSAQDFAAATDADGRYRLDKLAPGAVKVYFRLADGRVQWAYRKLSYEEADEVTLALGTVTTVNDQLLPS